MNKPLPLSPMVNRIDRRVRNSVLSGQFCAFAAISQSFLDSEHRRFCELRGMAFCAARVTLRFGVPCITALRQFVEDIVARGAEPKVLGSNTPRVIATMADEQVWGRSCSSAELEGKTVSKSSVATPVAIFVEGATPSPAFPALIDSRPELLTDSELRFGDVSRALIVATTKAFSLARIGAVDDRAKAARSHGNSIAVSVAA